MFLGDGKPLSRSSKIELLVGIIFYYYEYGISPQNLYSTLKDDRFEHTDNIRDLFQRYKIKMGKYGYDSALRQIRESSQQMNTVRLLLDGKIGMSSFNEKSKKLTIRGVD